MMENQRKKILLVDDDVLYLEITEAMLQEKYEVITAGSGKDAVLLLVKGFTPDLILLDIMMPKMDGWETFKTIRGLTLLNDIPIAFLTSLTSTDDISQAQDIGAVDFIMKPFERNTLIDRIEKIFAGVADKSEK